MLEVRFRKTNRTIVHVVAETTSGREAYSQIPGLWDLRFIYLLTLLTSEKRIQSCKHEIHDVNECFQMRGKKKPQ